MKTILFLIFSCLMTVANSKPINVVEIANFYCTQCYQANGLNSHIENVVNKGGGVFDFVPIFLEANFSWPAKIYHSLPEDMNIKNKARDALFKATNVSGITLRTKEATCIVVHDGMPSYSVRQCLKDANSNRSNSHFDRALMLLKNIYPDSSAKLLFPIYIIEKDNEINNVLARDQYPDINALVEEVVRNVKTLQQS